MIILRLWQIVIEQLEQLLNRSADLPKNPKTMIIAEVPADEALRLIDLASYNILDTPAEEDFDELVELAAQICKCPISLITLLDKDRQWFKAKQGFSPTGTSRDVAFCSHAILQNDVMIVEDAKQDARFADNPLVTGDTNIRFYAGAPIVSPAGHKLGTICIIDHEPKKLSDEQKRALTLLSNQVSRLLDLRKKNIVIRERATEIIALKSKTIGRVMQGQEDDKMMIAARLHEDLAQRIAAGILCLDSAMYAGSDNAAMINDTKEYFRDILVDMRSLTNTITPYARNILPAAELIKEFAEKMATSFSFRLKVNISVKNNEGGSGNALHAIRVIEQWFKILGNEKELCNVQLTIQTNKAFELHIEDDGPACNFEDRRQAIFDSLIYDRVNAEGGTVDLSTSSSGKNKLTISLPLQRRKETVKDTAMEQVDQITLI